MTLTQRLLKYIIAKYPLTDDDLLAVAEKAGFTASEVYTALTAVAKDKRIKTSTRGGSVVYTLTVARPVAGPPTHVEWLRAHYPWPDHFEMPFPEIDMGYMFLRTHEERLEYKAAASGRPVHMVQSRKYDKSNT